MIFDYAVSFDIIQINLSRQVRGFSDKNFKPEIERPVEEIVYNTEAKHSVIKEAMEQFLKTQNIAYVAVCLNFSLGLRVGELVALRTSHINNDGTITICQEETKTYHKDSDGTIHRDGYEIVNHTKTLSGNRRLVLTPKARKYIDMALKYNEANGLRDEDFIFLDKSGKRIHDHAVNNVIRRLNGVRNEKDNFIIEGRPSGNHSIRRTTISELHEAMVISEDTLKTFAGHKDISTTQKCYIHQTKDITEYKEEFAKVLDS
jgi:integrase